MKTISNLMTALLTAVLSFATLAVQAGNDHVAGRIERIGSNRTGTIITYTTINVNALRNPQGVHGHFSLRTVRTLAATGAFLDESLFEADIYDILVIDNAAYIAGILTQFIANGQEVDLGAAPGRVIIKLTDNGEGEHALPDTQSPLGIMPEEFVNDPEFPFNLSNAELLDLLSSRPLAITTGNITVQNR